MPRLSEEKRNELEAFWRMHIPGWHELSRSCRLQRHRLQLFRHRLKAVTWQVRGADAGSRHAHQIGRGKVAVIQSPGRENIRGIGQAR